LGTKSTANTAGTNAATAMADASAASSAASAAQTSVQGTIDAGINAIRNTPGVAGQAVEGWAEALASIPTQNHRIHRSGYRGVDTPAVGGRWVRRVCDRAG
ncbi:hypothetical protein, partial [Mycobacteroides abscessus]|uniref:hypothetical protein n=1 Tax=Mycobacteroides abscessus TaxID=36809 RepID=UPI001F40F4B8